jgi:hypothetical protein
MQDRRIVEKWEKGESQKDRTETERKRCFRYSYIQIEYIARYTHKNGNIGIEQLNPNRHAINPMSCHAPNKNNHDNNNRPVNRCKPYLGTKPDQTGLIQSMPVILGQTEKGPKNTI